MHSTHSYDAIVVGARCAGSPTAMLLARQGYRVLLVDRDGFPSDTISTHLIHPPGIALLRRWALLDRLVATRCPSIDGYRFDFGAFSIAGRPAPIDGIAQAYAPRRTILDKLLVDAAAEAGAEVREHFTVQDVVVENGQVAGIRGRTEAGTIVDERARVVIGADGRHSTIAQAVHPQAHDERAPFEVGYYTYWSDLPADGWEVYVRRRRGWGAIPTHDDLTLLIVGWPYDEFEANRTDVERHYLAALELAPEFADRVRRATRQDRLRGGAVASYVRTPFGPGWALVGDAGYDKDPLTAWGISDAFRDAELCAGALNQWFLGLRPFDEVMGEYQAIRDRQSMPMFELTCTLATLEPPPPDTQRLLEAVAASRPAQDQFVSMMAGTLPVSRFFSPANVGGILAEPRTAPH